MQVESLFVYPLKSGRALPVSSLRFDAQGPRYDRRWMVVRPDGCFVTQRDYPALGKVAATPVEAGLVLQVAEQPPLLVSMPSTEVQISCRIWSDQVRCLDCGDAAARLLSQHLRTEARLVHAADSCFERKMRKNKREFTDQRLGLADAFPVLLLSAAAIDLLSERCGQQVSSLRFRPNIVISGADAHAEDGWQKIRIGEAEVAILQPCVRCSVPALDPDGCTETPGFNRALASYRRFDGKITFGQNGTLLNMEASIKAGDPVKVLAP